MKKPVLCETVTLADVYDLVLGSEDARLATPPDERVQRHLETCPRCRMRVLDVTRIARAVQEGMDEDSIPIDGRLEERIRQRIASIDETTRKSRNANVRPRTGQEREVTPPPVDPARVREVLGAPPARVSNEPLRSAFRGGFGGDPGRPAFWLPAVAALVLVFAGGGIGLWYLYNYEPEPAQKTSVAKSSGRESPDRPGAPDPVERGGEETPDRPGGGEDPGTDGAAGGGGGSENGEGPAAGSGEVPGTSGPGPGPEVPGVEGREPLAGQGPERTPTPRIAETLAPVLVHVEAKKGEIRVQTAGESGERAFAPGSALAPDDVLVFPMGCLAALRIVGGGTLVAGEGSELSLAGSDGSYLARIHRGRAIFETAPGERPFLVETPHALVWHESTRFEVGILGDSTSLVTVEGKAILETPAGRVEVEAGSASRSVAGGAPEEPRQVDTVDAIDWTLALATGRETIYEKLYAEPPVLEATSAQPVVLQSEEFSLVEGESYAVRTRLQAGDEWTPVSLALLARAGDGKERVVLSRGGPVGTDARDLGLSGLVPLDLAPETRYRVEVGLHGGDTSIATRTLRVEGITVERLVFERRRAIDHDFHRENPRGWSRLSGAWEVEGGRLAGRPTATREALLVLPPTQAFLGDYHVGATGSAEEEVAYGIAFRVQDGRNGYRFLASRVRDGDRWLRSYRLEAVEDGRARTLAESASPEDAESGAHLSLAVRVHEDKIEATSGGRVVLWTADSTYRKGAVGLVTLGGEAKFARAIVDDYR